jgi:hypothetical protein
MKEEIMLHDDDLIAAKEALRDAGHDVGPTHVLYEGAAGKIKVQMDGALFTRDEILEFANEEKTRAAHA